MHDQEITDLRTAADRHVIALGKEIEIVSNRLTELQLEELAARELIGHLIGREDAIDVARA